MRVRVAYTAEISDEDRRVIAAYNDDAESGSRRLATREEVRDWFRALGYDNGKGVIEENRWRIEDGG